MPLAADHNPCFVLHVWSAADQKLARSTIAEINSFYPDSPLFVIGDGVEPNALGVFIPVIGERLKTPEFGGEWTQRYLDLFLEHTACQVLIRLDPDTKLLRRFNYFPSAAVFGCKTEWGTTRGGCVGFSRQGAAAIASSGYLRDDKYRNNRQFLYSRYSLYRKPYEKIDGNPITLQDRIVADVVDRLNLETADWSDEVNILFREGCPLHLNYAAIHPKDLY